MGGRGIAFAAACLGTLGIALIGAPSASASVVTAQLSMNGAIVGGSTTGTISITAGDAVTFVKGPPPNQLTAGFYVVLHANPAAGLNSNRTLKTGDSATIVFPGAGSWTFTWDGYNGLNIKLSGHPSVTVVATAPDPGTPAPTSSAAGGGGGGTTSLPAGSTAPGGVVSESRSGSASASGSRGAGFSFGPGADTGTPARGTASESRSSSGGFPSTSGGPTPYVTTMSIVQANVTKRSGGGPSSALAIISILALASVGGTFAYMRLAPEALRVLIRPILPIDRKRR